MMSSKPKICSFQVVAFTDGGMEWEMYLSPCRIILIEPITLQICGVAVLVLKLVTILVFLISRTLRMLTLTNTFLLVLHITVNLAIIIISKFLAQDNDFPAF